MGMYRARSTRFDLQLSCISCRVLLLLKVPLKKHERNYKTLRSSSLCPYVCFQRSSVFGVLLVILAPNTNFLCGITGWK